MTRRFLSIGLSLFLLACVSVAPVTAQDRIERGNEEPRVSPNAAVSQTIGTTQVRITYSRPQVKGREIFGGLVSYDEVWRTGANEATTFAVSTDVMIEGEPLSAGTYSLYTIPGEDHWTLIFNNVAEQWGTNYDQSEDALRVTVSPESGPQQEMMTFLFEEVTEETGIGVLHWNETRVPFEIQVAGN